MCGILGISSTYRLIPSVTQLFQGLRLLQNRGYDSAGIAMIKHDASQIVCHKYASTTSNNSIDLLEQHLNEELLLCHTGIAHTRWATHGGKTDQNAHPHQSGKFAIVHNGIIENHAHLREFLISQGYVFASQTDSEVIAHLLSYFDTKNPNQFVQTIRAVMERLEGTYAIAMICVSDPQCVFAFCHGSPMVIGIDKTRNISMVASESLGFGNNDMECTCLPDGGIAVLNNGSLSLHQLYTDVPLTVTSSRLSLDSPIEMDFDRQRFNSWLEKEIAEQPESIQRALNNGGRLLNNHAVKLGGLERHTVELRRLQHLVLLGCGTSYYAGMFALSYFRQLCGFTTVTLFDGAEFTMDDIPKHGETGFVFLSQSGETKDLQRCLALLPNDAVTIGVINVVNSMIARSVKCGVYLNAGREVSVASTKSFTNMVLVLLLIVCWFSDKHFPSVHTDSIRQILGDMQCLSGQFQTLLDSQVEFALTLYLQNRPTTPVSMFVLGRGSGEAIALEGSLKLKEVAYVHAEGKSAASLKHGPFALIHHGLPIVFIDDGSTKIQNAIHEVAARDSKVFVLGPHASQSHSGVVNLEIPYNATFGGLLANLVIQKASMKLAYAQHLNPDFPRNLAKVVTVE